MQYKGINYSRRKDPSAKTPTIFQNTKEINEQCSECYYGN